MADSSLSPQDLEALAEQLWGPGEAAAPDWAAASAAPRRDQPVAAAAAPVEAARLDAFEQQVRQAVSNLRDAMSARHAELVGRTRSELRAVRSNVDATLNHRLNQARSNMTAAVAGLSERLDGVEARIEQVAKAAETSEVARIVTLENQIREGIARLEESIARQHADWAEQARAELVARPPATPPTA